MKKFENVKIELIRINGDVIVTSTGSNGNQEQNENNGGTNLDD